MKKNRMESAGMILLFGPLALTGISAFGTMAWTGGMMGPPNWLISMMGVSGMSVIIGGFLLIYGQSRRHRGL